MFRFKILRCIAQMSNLLQHLESRKKTRKLFVVKKLLNQLFVTEYNKLSKDLPTQDANPQLLLVTRSSLCTKGQV